MQAVTKLDIWLSLESGQSVDAVLVGLPGYSKTSFAEGSPGEWHGDFIVSCPVAPKLAEGDFEDDLAPHFPLFLSLLRFHNARFQLQIAVGPPGPDEFHLPANMLALVAALGASLRVTTSLNPDRLEVGLDASIVGS